MKYQNILITGASGNLGKALIASSLKDRNLLTPSHSECDITNKESISKYISSNNIDAIIHCAAVAKVGECERDPLKALLTNSTGTNNIVSQILQKNTRFIYISTDYVYLCQKGPYKEEDQTKPFTIYGWTKLGGECSASLIKNYCIIRTSFFTPNNIPFDTAPNDAYCSKLPINELAKNIVFLLDSDFIGTINVGCERSSLYEIFRQYKPEIKPISFKDLPVQRAQDSSLDITLWKSVSKS